MGFMLSWIIFRILLKHSCLVLLWKNFFKWFMFMFLIYQHEEFDNHYDGIVYASAISLGFASLENVFYLLSNGIEFAWMRALYPVSSHALFGIIMGYYLGKAKMNSKYKRRYLTIAFLLPFLLHGIYNYILLGLNQFIIILSIFFSWCMGFCNLPVKTRQNL